MNEVHIPLKVIFLDVDGVLCLNEYAVLEPPLLDNLALVVESTDAVVAVSSDWRLFPSKFTELCRALRLRKIRVIGKTSSVNGDAARPQEIVGFVTSFHAKMKRQSKPYRISRWVAVDDRDLPTEEGGEYMTSRRFVHTEMKTGLTFKVAMEMIGKLNRMSSGASKEEENEAKREEE